MKPVLTIAIPTWRNAQQLTWCVQSLFSFTEFPFKIVIVNNEPTDNARLLAWEQESDVGDRLSVLNMGRNARWAGAVNAALLQCDTPFFCMMNDDVVFVPGQKDFWQRLMAPLNDINVGAVGPSSNFVMGAQSILNIAVPLIADVNLLIGFCMAVRTGVFRDMGGLDDSLPGGDDLDLSIRMKQAGLTLVARKDAYLHHFGQQTGRRVDGDKWDSLDQQELVENALVRKHGVRAVYDCRSMAYTWWQPELKEKEAPLELHEKTIVARWVKEWKDIGGVGMNLGSGADDGDEFGRRLDVAMPGSHGVGGRASAGASPEVVGDAADLAVATGTLDFIVAKHLFEHMLDPCAALDEWRRVLKDSGELFLVVPDHGQWETMACDCSHVHAYTKESLVGLLCRLGWQVEEVIQTQPFPYSIACRARKAVKA